ncbi:hypothetical protein [Candidatus Vallotia tarda]|nr:hypothetical protein [Candidatus Vallotia tarda]
MCILEPAEGRSANYLGEIKIYVCDAPISQMRLEHLYERLQRSTDYRST